MEDGPNYQELNNMGSSLIHSRVGRIEPYVDEENVREAMSYGDTFRKLVIWYDLEQFQRSFPHWIQPNPSRPPFENTKNQ